MFTNGSAKTLLQRERDHSFMNILISLSNNEYKPPPLFS